MTSILQLRFGHAYEVEALGSAELARDKERRIHFSGVTDIADRRPYAVHVAPWEGRPWIGMFNRYSESPDAVTGCFSYPDPNTLCVISGGQAYIVDVIDPTDWAAVGAVPVVSVHDLPERKLIFFVDYTNITAYDETGFRWRTKRLSYDGVAVVTIDSRFLRGLGWSAPDGEHVEFLVDVDTGQHEGGASPHGED